MLSTGCVVTLSLNGKRLPLAASTASLFTLPAAAEWAGPWSRGGGGGRPGEDVNRAPELAREGGRRGPEVAGTLVEGVGGRMEDEEVATAEADEGGLTGVLLLRRRETRRHEEHSKNHTSRMEIINIYTLVRPVVDVVYGVRSSGQSEEGFGFGEWRAAVVSAAVAVGTGTGERASGCTRRGQAGEGGGRGRRTDGLGEMLLQALLLAPLQARDSRGHHQPRHAAAAGLQRRAAFTHRRGGHARRRRLCNCGGNRFTCGRKKNKEGRQVH